MKKLKQVYIFGFILILFIINLPQFQLNIGDKQFVYPNIDLSIISPDSTLGNFSKGTGLFDSKLYSSEVDLATLESKTDKDGVFKELLNIVKTRAFYSNLSDVEIYGTISDSKYFVNIVFPEHYEESEKLNQALLANGSISFESDPNVSTEVINLADTDIVGSIKSAFNEQYGNSLEFTFKADKATDLAIALNNQNNYFLMRVDTSFFAVVSHPGYQNSQSPDLKTFVLAVPFADIKLSSNVAIYNNIVRSYFLTPPLNNQFLTNNNFTVVNRDFVQDRLSHIAIFIVAGIALILLIALYKKGFNFGFKLFLLTSSYCLLLLTLLKLQSAVLSISLVIGFLLALSLNFIISFNLLKITSESKIVHLLNEIRLFSFFIIVLMFAVLKFLGLTYYLYDFFGVLTASAICLILLSTLNYKYILQFEFSFPKFKLKR